MSKKEPTFHVCMRVSDQIIPLVPSHVKDCSFCHELVWVAMKKWALTHAPKGSKRICNQCMTKYIEEHPDEEMTQIN